jgi:hypothetical protein
MNPCEQFWDFLEKSKLSIQDNDDDIFNLILEEYYKLLDQKNVKYIGPPTISQPIILVDDRPVTLNTRKFKTWQELEIYLNNFTNISTTVILIAGISKTVSQTLDVMISFVVRSFDDYLGSKIEIPELTPTTPVSNILSGDISHANNLL